MNTSDNDEPNSARDAAESEHERPRRSTSRDLDAIAARLAGAQASGTVRPSAEADRTRDAARIRSLIDRSPDDGFVPAARGYASALPEIPATTPARGEDHAEIEPIAARDRSDAPTSSAVPGADPIRFPRQDEVDDLARPMPAARPRRLARAIAVGVTATAGLVIALGAYAGGGELISSIIEGDDRAAAPSASAGAVLAPVIVDSVLSTADSIAEAEQLASFGELPNDTIRRAPFGSGRIVRLPVAARPRIGDTLRPQGQRSGTPTESSESSVSKSSAATTSATKPQTTTPQPAKSQLATSKTPTDPSSKAASTRPSAPATETSRATAAQKREGVTASRGAAYLVQVRATPDRAEADRLASRLRSRGSTNVTVTPSTKDGATVYRVRYGSYPSADAARTAARRDGHANAWVVRR